MFVFLSLVFFVDNVCASGSGALVGVVRPLNDVDLTNDVVEMACFLAACTVRYSNGSAALIMYKSEVALTNTDNGREVDLSSNVAAISCSDLGFFCFAQFTDGSATVWGNQEEAGNLSRSYDGRYVNLESNVVSIVCGGAMCVVQFVDGSATTWGVLRDSTPTNVRLSLPLRGNVDVDLSSNVVGITCGRFVCGARFTNGSAVVWGDPENGGDLSKTGDKQVVDLSSGVVDLSCGDFSCFARFSDGSGAVWGNLKHGGNTTLTDGRFVNLSSNVVDISCFQACSARFVGGSATVWGDLANGGDLSKTVGGQVDLSSNVSDIMCGGAACCARFTDGSAKVWGNPLYGGDFTLSGFQTVNLDSDVVDISCGIHICYARFNDGSAAIWGTLFFGGNLQDYNGRFVDISRDVTAISCGFFSCAVQFLNRPPPLVVHVKPECDFNPYVIVLAVFGAGAVFGVPLILSFYNMRV